MTKKRHNTVRRTLYAEYICWRVAAGTTAYMLMTVGGLDQREEVCSRTRLARLRCALPAAEPVPDNDAN